MNDITPALFISPFIALFLTCYFYILLLKRTSDRNAFKRFVINNIITAFILNLTWELMQLPFYNASFYDLKHVSFCALASVADIIMALLIYFVFAFIYKNTFWIGDFKWQSMAVVSLTGGVGAVISEMRHLSSGSWAYASYMPVMPYLNVGLLPVLQFMILPLLTYSLSLYFMNKKQVKIA